MDPSINSIVNARRRFASVMHLYPRSGESGGESASQHTMPIDRFDRIVCTTYETIVDVHRFPLEQVQICIDKEAGKLIVCGYREGDVPQFGFKSDFFKELDIPLGVDKDSITATYEDCGYVHFSLPCSTKKKIRGREMTITPVGLRLPTATSASAASTATAAPTLLSPRKTSDRGSCCTAPVPYSAKTEAQNGKTLHSKTESFESQGNRSLSSAKSTGNLSSSDSNRTIWDKPFVSNALGKQSAPPVTTAPVKLQPLSSASFSGRSKPPPPEQSAVNAARHNFEQRATLAPVKTSEVNLSKLGKPTVSECVKSFEKKSSCESSFTQNDYSLESIKTVESTESKKTESSFSSIKRHTDRLAANLDSFKKEMKEANAKIAKLFQMAENPSYDFSDDNKLESSFNNRDGIVLQQMDNFKELYVPVKVTDERYYKTENIEPTYKFIESESIDASKMSNTKHSNDRVIPIEIVSSDKTAKNVKYNSTLYIEEENYETEI
ncbi:hypothetical protein TYRP_017654 [Tyrophagus putrescentiae]|nr:hypothetical protein TYRP_017654 [Tyrophagus putrescentiae]